MGARAGRGYFLLRPNRPEIVRPSLALYNFGIPGATATVTVSAGAAEPGTYVDGATATVTVSAPVGSASLSSGITVLAATAMVQAVTPAGSALIPGVDIEIVADTSIVYANPQAATQVLGAYYPGDLFNLPILLTGVSGSFNAAGNLTTEPGETWTGPAGALATPVSSQWFQYLTPVDGGTMTVQPTSSTPHFVELLTGDDFADLELLGESDGLDGSPEGFVAEVGGNQIVYIRVSTEVSTGTALPVDWSIAVNTNPIEFDVLTPNVPQTPGTISFAVWNVEPYEQVTFDVLGYPDTYVGEADGSGYVAVMTVALDARPAGTYTLRATGTSGQVGTVAFQILADPPELPTTPPAPSAPPVVVQTGVRHWVFSDPMPGGLGIWTMAQNPDAMSTPHAPLPMEFEVTTSPEGQAHVWVGAVSGHSWTFSGFVMTEAELNELVAYGALKRRIHIIDHRNRAWTCTIEKLDLTPVRPRETGAGTYPWRHRYTVSALILAGPVTP
jgi:hypothetical protein